MCCLFLEVINSLRRAISLYFYSLVLEVYQFARDAAVAEAWLIAHESYLQSGDYGKTLDAVEALIKKHESFEKSAATQEERFTALEKLTTVRRICAHKQMMLIICLWKILLLERVTVIHTIVM